jgi:hypothetical protein
MVALAAFGDFGFDQRLDVLVIDMLLAVGEVLEAIEGVLKGIVAQLKAQLLTSFSLKAWRPECLPMTRLVSRTPTSSGRMIS